MSVVVSAVVVAAEAWGTAAFVGAALTAVADVGVASSLIGAVTGNKTLVKVGGALSIVGGVGGLINSAVGAGASVAADTLVSGATSAAGDVAADGIAAAGADAGASAASGAAAGAGAGLGGEGLAAANAGAEAGASQLQALGDTAKFGATSGTGAATGAAVDNGLSITGQGAAAAPGAATDFSGALQSAGGPTPSGMYATPATPLADAASPVGSASSGIAGAAGTAGPATFIDQLKSGFDSTSAWFNGLPKVSQDMVTKSLLAIPGGIQAQKNAAAQMAIAQQKVNQTSYGNSTPTFNSTANPTTGILSNAMRK